MGADGKLPADFMRGNAFCGIISLYEYIDEIIKECSGSSFFDCRLLRRFYERGNPRNTGASCR